MDDNEKYWTDEANTLLKGRRIAGVRYLTATEAEDYAWDSRGPSAFPRQRNRASRICR
jgi:hypothetical protein